MKTILYHLIITLCNLLPIKKRKIFLMSYYGNQYGCNPKYLSEYIVKHHPEWKVVWGFTHPEEHLVPGITKVRYLSLRYFYELCTSKVFVTNYRMTNLYKKRKGQLYIQTWHSSLRLKMIEGDAEQTLPPHYVHMAKEDSKQTDVLLSGCSFSTDIFKRAFWYQGEIAPTGTPREDLMFSNDEHLKDSIREKLGVTKDQHLLLYAPTFRKDNSLEYYNINFREITKILEKKGEKWTILLRLHPHLRDFSKQLLGKDSNIIDTTAFDDIQELLYVADMVISDYSSLIFDFALTKRPCLLYVPDLEEYTSHDRQLYFNIHELPFPICESNEDLQMTIDQFDISRYKNNVDTFLARIGSYETGHSCENVMKLIENKINER